MRKIGEKIYETTTLRKETFCGAYYLAGREILEL